MTGGSNGNLAGVFTEYARMVDEQEKRMERTGPFTAQAMPDHRASWHLVKTAPSRESTAAAHLVGRRFGTYLPIFGADIVLPKSGLCRAGKPMFPGYLFLFVWSIQDHWRRICACPGINSIVTIDERPVIVPDSVIDEIQVLEALNGKLDDFCRAGRRGWRKRRKDTVPVGTVTISTRSAFSDLGLLDDGGRIGVLHKALGLVSNASAAS